MTPEEIIASLAQLERLVCARLAELREAVAALPLRELAEGRHFCPHDGLWFRTPERLGEHLANVHASA